MKKKQMTFSEGGKKGQRDFRKKIGEVKYLELKRQAGIKGAKSRYAKGVDKSLDT